VAAAAEVLDADGFVILPNVLRPDEIETVREAMDPLLAAGPRGRNDFEGYTTKRVYCLVAKSRAFDRMILYPTVLMLAEHVLGAGFLLTAALAIDLQPGETAQSFHYDDIFYRLPRPRPSLSLSTMWAIDDFTVDNGATLLYRGSHRWGEQPPVTEPEVAYATMPAGSVLVYHGTLVHAGGGNTSTGDRLGISLQYAVAWGRQQENFMMAIGVDGARALPARLQELIGYSIHPPFMGMIDGLHPRRLLER
jgi:ectoine hydroxylase-related dioxygenase (phytanoyl-CoA dioxygenase family)